MPPDLQDLADQLTLDSSAAIGIPLALVAAVFLAFGNQFQNRGVSLVDARTTSDAKKGLSLSQIKALLATPSWVLGTVLLGGAIVLQLTSLAFAPLIGSYSESALNTTLPPEARHEAARLRHRLQPE